MNQTNLWGVAATPPTRCKITNDRGLLVFTSPYDPDLVADLKMQIPNTERKYNPANKSWTVSPQYGPVLVKLADKHCREIISIPAVLAVTAVAAISTMRLLDVRYLGQCKDRGDGTLSAFAYLVDGEWGAVFPETVLRIWFESEDTTATPSQSSTLYGVLGAKHNATPDELKSAFRRAARATHPDVCKDVDAEEMFKRVNHAWQILSNDRTRARYDAGLALEATISKPADKSNWATMQQGGYRSPLRCGYILSEGTEKLSRFLATRILAWQDITLGDRTLVTSWPMGAKKPLEVWS
jgi:hypothetical protein